MRITKHLTVEVFSAAVIPYHSEKYSSWGRKIVGILRRPLPEDGSGGRELQLS
jgi:hypothetical protein